MFKRIKAFSIADGVLSLQFSTDEGIRAGDFCSRRPGPKLLHYCIVSL